MNLNVDVNLLNWVLCSTTSVFLLANFNLHHLYEGMLKNARVPPSFLISSEYWSMVVTASKIPVPDPIAPGLAKPQLSYAE